MDLETLKELVTQTVGGRAWVGQVFVIVFLTLLAAYLQRRLIRRLVARSRDTGNIIDDALLLALSGPLGALIWVLGIAFAAQIVAAKSEAPIFQIVTPLRLIAVVSVIAWFLVRLVNQYQHLHIERRVAQGREVDRTAVLAVGKLLRASIIITSALVMMQSLGFSISGVLAFGGVGGIAVGFAARDLIANLFGGLTVYLDRPFSVGDWIRSPDREIEGTVEDIGWRRTVIRTFDKRVLYVPNAAFTTISVENPSRMTNRRIKETIGVRYDDMDKVPQILEAVREMLRNHSEIDQGQTLMVNLNEFADSSVNFFIYTFTRTTAWAEYHRIKEDVLLKIAEIVAGFGGEIAFPTRTLHIADEVAFVPAARAPETTRTR